MHRHAFVQPAVDRDSPVGAFAGAGQPAEAAGVGAGKAITGEKIRRVEEQIVGEQVRIDMIDLRSKTNRVLLAPGC